MSGFSLDTVRHLANLARIELSLQEVQRFMRDLTVITDAVEVVNGVASADIVQTTHPLPLNNVYRDDVVGHTLDPDIVFAQAPHHDEGMFVVPTILDEE